MKGFIKSLMYVLFYIITSVILAFLYYKIAGVTVEQAYTYIFLGVLASEVSTLKVNENDRKKEITK